MAVASRANSGGLAPFLYVAAAGTGSRRYGVRRARSRRDLSDQLRRERLVPLHAWQVPGMSSETTGKLSLSDQGEVHQQLSQLLGRSVPLIEALDVTATAVGAKMRPRVLRIGELVASGSSFADACHAVGAFDAVTIAVYKASERTGDLAGAAKQLSLSLRRQIAIAQKTTTMMVYPCILGVVTLSVSTYLMSSVVPKIAASLPANNMPLPTKIIVTVGKFMNENLLWLGLGALALITLLVLMRHALRGPLTRLSRKLPILREMVVAVESGRFFTVMAAMTRAGVPLADCFGMSASAVKDPDFRAQIARLRFRLIEGGALRTLINDVTMLPAATRRLLIAGERSGDLETVFDTLATDMSDEVDRRSSRLLAALEPLIIIVMFAIVGSIVTAIMIPLLNAAQQVG